MAPQGNINSGIPASAGAEDGGRDPETEPTELARALAREIGERGPITFHEFMERALYEPGKGYYSRARTAWDGDADFVTAPQVDPALGRAIARLAVECDAALGEQAPFDVVDCGGGDGVLLADLCDELERAAPELYQRLAVRSVEQGRAARERQRQRLAHHGDRVAWLASIDELATASVRGLVLSNELLDAFPVHRVRQRGDRLREIHVDVDRAGELTERELAPSTDALADYLASNDIALADGQPAEICLAVEPWLATVSAALEAGYLLTVDYGAETGSLYDPARGSGTLACQYRYQLNGEPLMRVGEQDISAHVDFGNYRRCAARVGLEPVGDASLAVFLVGFGATDELAASAAAGRAGPQQVREALGLRHLLFTEIGSAHRALLARKGATPLPFGLDRLD